MNDNYGVTAGNIDKNIQIQTVHGNVTHIPQMGAKFPTNSKKLKPLTLLH